MTCGINTVSGYWKYLQSGKIIFQKFDPLTFKLHTFATAKQVAIAATFVLAPERCI